MARCLSQIGCQNKTPQAWWLQQWKRVFLPQLRRLNARHPGAGRPRVGWARGPLTRRPSSPGSHPGWGPHSVASLDLTSPPQSCWRPGLTLQIPGDVIPAKHTRFCVTFFILRSKNIFDVWVCFWKQISLDRFTFYWFPYFLVVFLCGNPSLVELFTWVHVTLGWNYSDFSGRVYK